MDSTTFHSFKVAGNTFEVNTRYSLVRPIGHGAYGVVISAQDKETGEKVAIKKITNAFNDVVDAKRILREIKLMNKFVHENVIRIRDVMPLSPTTEDFEDIYICQDLMETDLHRIIYSKQALTIDHIQYFVYQILRGLKYVHSANVLHRDLKPSNLLVNGNCDLKICDFGLSRSVSAGDDTSTELTEYVVTRWYRAPEIMLACNGYTKAIDVWSVGCIFAELLARAPLFPGEDYLGQLQLICQKMGRPSEAQLSFITSERAKRFMLGLPRSRPTPAAEMFPSHRGERNAHDLLFKMLAFDPNERISVDDALDHPFLQSLHNLEDEPRATFTFSFDFENEELNKERIQTLIWEELRSYHPDAPELFPSSARSGSSRKAGKLAAEAKADSKSSETDEGGRGVRRNPRSAEKGEK